MKVGLFGFEDTCVKAYDPEETDPAKKLVGIYKNYKDAGNKLGMTAVNAQHGCAEKRLVFSATYNKRLALRLSTNKVNEQK